MAAHVVTTPRPFQRLGTVPTGLLLSQPKRCCRTFQVTATASPLQHGPAGLPRTPPPSQLPPSKEHQQDQQQQVGDDTERMGDALLGSAGGRNPPYQPRRYTTFRRQRTQPTQAPSCDSAGGSGGTESELRYKASVAQRQWHNVADKQQQQQQQHNVASKQQQQHNVAAKQQQQHNVPAKQQQQQQQQHATGEWPAAVRSVQEAIQHESTSTGEVNVEPRARSDAMPAAAAAAAAADERQHQKQIGVSHNHQQHKQQQLKHIGVSHNYQQHKQQQQDIEGEQQHQQQGRHVAGPVLACEQPPDLTAKPAMSDAWRRGPAGGAWRKGEEVEEEEDGDYQHWQDLALRLPAVGRDLLSLPLHHAFQVMVGLRQRYGDDQWALLRTVGVTGALHARLEADVAGGLPAHRLATVLDCCREAGLNPGTTTMQAVAQEVHARMGAIDVPHLASVYRCLAHFRYSPGQEWGRDLLASAAARAKAQRVAVAASEGEGKGEGGEGEGAAARGATRGVVVGAGSVTPECVAHLLWSAASLGVKVPGGSSIAPLLRVFKAGMGQLSSADLSAGMWGAAVLGLGLQEEEGQQEEQQQLHRLGGQPAPDGGGGMGVGVSVAADDISASDQQMDVLSALLLLETLALQASGSCGGMVAAWRLAPASAALAGHATELSPREVARALKAVSRAAHGAKQQQQQQQRGTADGAASAGNNDKEEGGAAAGYLVPALLRQAEQCIGLMEPHDVCVVLTACRRLGCHPGQTLLTRCMEVLRSRWNAVTCRQAESASRCLRAFSRKPFLDNPCCGGE